MPFRHKIADHIVKIIDNLQKAGFETYLVGGAVRDLILERGPKDYDISTAAHPHQIREILGRRHSRIIGRRFRLVHLYHGHEIIEISTFRRNPQQNSQDIYDNGKENNLPPKVIRQDNEYGTSYEDAWRRDFTVNAIFFDPLQNKIIDHTGMGIDDLKNGIVRSVGDPMIRFEEDPVRMLRALKLVGQYNFRLTPETENALIASMYLITACSKSRLTLELEKIMRKPYCDTILEAFYRRGFLTYFLPFINENWNSEPGEYMKQLLIERNSRLQRGLYHDSISLAIATTALPFVEISLNKTEGQLWEYNPGIEKEIKKIIRKIFYPYHFPRRIIASSLAILLIQPYFFQKRKREKIMRHHYYRHARELMIRQNTVKWNNPDLPAFWSSHGKREKSSCESNFEGYYKG